MLTSSGPWAPEGPQAEPGSCSLWEGPRESPQQLVPSSDALGQETGFSLMLPGAPFIRGLCEGSGPRVGHGTLDSVLPGSIVSSLGPSCPPWVHHALPGPTASFLGPEHPLGRLLLSVPLFLSSESERVQFSWSIGLH